MPPVPAAPLVVALLVAAAAVSGAILLALTPDPFATSSAALLTGGLGLLTLITVAGLLLARGRWARRLGVVLAIAWMVVGTAIDTLWGLVLVVLAAIALAGLSGPWLGRWLRRLPTADGAPPAVVLALLSLVGTPAALAGSSPGGSGIAAWVFSGWSCLLALALARMLPGSLGAARVVHPIAAVATAVVLGLPGAVAALLSGSTVALLVWRREVAVAVVPVVPTMTVHRLPPELAPPSVLAAAGADESGRLEPR